MRAGVTPTTTPFRRTVAPDGSEVTRTCCGGVLSIPRLLWTTDAQPGTPSSTRIDAATGQAANRMCPPQGSPLNYGMANVPRIEPDPVIEVFKRDIDRTLLRENLKLTPEERLRKMQSAARSVLALREGAQKKRP
jgi:hypothetical protein